MFSATVLSLGYPCILSVLRGFYASYINKQKKNILELRAFFERWVISWQPSLKTPQHWEQSSFKDVMALFFLLPPCVGFMTVSLYCFQIGDTVRASHSQQGTVEDYKGHLRHNTQEWIWNCYMPLHSQMRWMKYEINWTCYFDLFFSIYQTSHSQHAYNSLVDIF